MALVPLAEASEDAMENKHFKKLLRKLGIRPPDNEQVCVDSFFYFFLVTFHSSLVHWFCFSNDNQERFWRISEMISPSELRSTAAALGPRDEEAVVGEEEDGPRDPTELQEDGEDVSGEQRAQALRALLLARKRRHHTNQDDGMCRLCHVQTMWVHFLSQCCSF